MQSLPQSKPVPSLITIGHLPQPDHISFISVSVQATLSAATFPPPCLTVTYSALFSLTLTSLRCVLHATVCLSLWRWTTHCQGAPRRTSLLMPWSVVPWGDKTGLPLPHFPIPTRPTRFTLCTSNLHTILAAVSGQSTLYLRDPFASQPGWIFEREIIGHSSD